MDHGEEKGSFASYPNRSSNKIVTSLKTTKLTVVILFIMMIMRMGFTQQQSRVDVTILIITIGGW